MTDVCTYTYNELSILNMSFNLITAEILRRFTTVSRVLTEIISAQQTQTLNTIDIRR